LVGLPLGAEDRLGAGVTGATTRADVTGADVPPILLTRKVMVVPEALISVMRTPVWPRAPPYTVQSDVRLQPKEYIRHGRRATYDVIPIFKIQIIVIGKRSW
jgi:hypothetical protein